MAKNSQDQTERRDPTVTSASAGERYPEGTHPAVPIDEGADSATNKVYEDMPDDQKPAASTVAQVEVRPEERE
jgi:hypothetical protein